MRKQNRLWHKTTQLLHKTVYHWEHPQKLRVTDVHQSWWQLASIQLSGAASLPVLMAGAALGETSGFYNGLISLLIGNIILVCLAIPLVILCFLQRSNILELTRQFLGSGIGMITGLALLIATLAWLPVQDIKSQTELQLLDHVKAYLCPSLCGLNLIILLGLLATLIASGGIRVIKWVSVISLPIVLLALVFFFRASESIPKSSFAISWSAILSSIPLIISIGISRTVDFPTFFRHGKGKREAIIGVFTTLGVVSVFELVGLLAGTKISVEHSFAAFPWLSVCFIVLSVVNANTTNIYAGSIGWELWVPGFIGKKEYFVLGLLGIVAACATLPSNFFENILEASETIIVGAGSVIAMNCLLMFYSKRGIRKKVTKSDRVANALSWLLGVTISLTVWFKTDRFSSLIAAYLICSIATIFIFYFRKVMHKHRQS